MIAKRTAPRCTAAKRAALLLLWLWALGSGAAWAHQSSVVYSQIRAEGREVAITLQVSHSDLYEALGLERDRPATRDEAARGAGRVGAYLLQRLRVENHGASCPGEALAHRVDDRYFTQELRFRCARSLEDATLTYNLFFDVDPRHQGLAHVAAFGGEAEHAFRDRSRALPLSHPLSAWDHARDYLLLGVEHIFTGYDHLAFLLGLLIIAGALGPVTPAAPGGRRLPPGLRHLLGVVTAFTLAHSLTLILSALRVVALPSRPVEIVIAASIGYVALENLVRPRLRARPLITFAFGLIHGFGFASVLREIGLPQRGLLLSLVSFNVGVELGQLLVVALVFPALRTLATLPGRDARGRLRAGLLLAGLSALSLLLFSRFDLPWIPLLSVAALAPALLFVLIARAGVRGYDSWVRIGGSVLLLALALLWCAERISERSLLGGALG